MSNSNEIKTFACLAGANIIPQEDYETLPAREEGFMSGIARSAQLNKVWRQSSFVSAALAQFVVDKGKLDVLDDGDYVALSEKIAQAIAEWVREVAPKTAIFCGTASGPGNAQILTPDLPIASYGTGVPEYIWIAGATNTGPLTISISGLPPYAVLLDGVNGPVPLVGGELRSGAVVTARFDGTAFRLENSEMGTASLQDATRYTAGGRVASVIGPVANSDFAVFDAIDGSIRSGGQRPAIIEQMLQSAVPSGLVASFASMAPPLGWLACDGSAVSRTAYSALFTAIGTTFGAGNGSTTFRVPDLRGEFIRGWDKGRGVDLGREFGSGQMHAMERITGRIGYALTDRLNHVAHTGAFYGGGSAVNEMETGNSGIREAYVNFDSGRVVETATETRPRNISLFYCIKY